MSRALDRLRSELGDELLVRVGRNYELTPRGNALMNELGQIMPRLARLWEGDLFRPRRAKRTFAGDDRLCRQRRSAAIAEILGRLAPGITLEVVPWHERTHEESGIWTTHLILSPSGSRPQRFALSLCSRTVFFAWLAADF